MYDGVFCTKYELSGKLLLCRSSIITTTYTRILAIRFHPSTKSLLLSSSSINHQTDTNNNENDVRSAEDISYDHDRLRDPFLLRAMVFVFDDTGSARLYFGHDGTKGNGQLEAGLEW